MRIELEETGSKGRYVAFADGGEVAGQMTFSRAGETLIIVDHTEVSDAFRGQGVGGVLVVRAVEDARASGRRIMPLCPFARGQFQKHPEFADVLSR